MPDYREMYYILFREMTKAVSALQSAQRQTEELYIEDAAADNVTVIGLHQESGNEEEKQLPQA